MFSSEGQVLLTYYGSRDPNIDDQPGHAQSCWDFDTTTSWEVQCSKCINMGSQTWDHRRLGPKHWAVRHDM